MGLEGTEELLEKLAAAYPDKKERIEQVGQKERERYLYYLAKLAPYYYRYHIQKEIALVGASPVVAALGSFLKQSLGQMIQTVLVTDEPGEEERKLLEKNFSKETRIIYTENAREIGEEIRKGRPEIILGSQLEESVARELNIPILYSSLPCERKVILSRSIFGVSGILSFLEEYAAAVIN